MFTGLKITQKALLLVLIPLLFEIGFAVTMIVMLQESEAEVQRELWAKRLLASQMVVYYSVQEAMKCMMIMVSGADDNYVRDYRRAIAPLKDAYQKSKEIARKEPATYKQLEIMEASGNRLAAGMDGVSSSIENNDHHQAFLLFQSLRPDFKAYSEQINNFRNQLLAVEKESPDIQLRQREKLKMVLAIGLTLNVLLAVILTILFNRDIARRLETLLENTLRLSSGTELKPLLGGVDELSRLDKVFHDMANALNEASERERAVVKNAQDVIFSIDQNGLFRAVNPASLKVWGYVPDELMGRNILHLIAEEDRDTTIGYLNAVKEGVDISAFENRFLRPDGKPISLLWSAYWSTKDELIFCVVHDVSERKEYEKRIVASESRVRSIIESMPVGILSLTSGGKIESVNPATASLFGVQSSMLEGKMLFDLFAETFLQTEEGMKRWLAEMSVEQQKLEMKMRRSDATEFPADVSLSTLYSPEGDKLLLTIQDVSARHELERIKQEFYAMVTHDLRTPLQAIGGSLTLLSAGVAGVIPPSASEMISMAERNCRRLNELVNDLLDLEKLESGKFEMLFDDVSLQRILVDAYELVKPLANTCKIQIELPQDDLVVYADDDRLVQVMVNLLSNAIKYSPSGGTVSVAFTKEVGEAKIAVSDQGSGIPAQYQAGLFERFKQVNRREARRKGSTGLGLAICKQLIEQHGGRIGVESSEGKGSTFWFTVPYISAP